MKIVSYEKYKQQVWSSPTCSLIWNLTRPPVGRGWGLVMLENKILLAEQFLTRQPKWSCDLQHSPLAFSELDGQSERPDPINKLVMLSSGTYMIVPTVFFKLFSWQTSTQPYFIIKGFRTFVFIVIVISPTFRPIRPPVFFRCLSNSGTYIELRTTSFIEWNGYRRWFPKLLKRQSSGGCRLNLDYRGVTIQEYLTLVPGYS